MILRELVNGVDIKNFKGDYSLNISGISFDSNKVKEHFLFVALTGENTDGHKYIESAVGNGAKALILENVPDKNFKDVSVVEVNDSRTSLAIASSNFYRHPTKELKLVGITGTKRKNHNYLSPGIYMERRK